MKIQVSTPGGVFERVDYSKNQSCTYNANIFYGTQKIPASVPTRIAGLTGGRSSAVLFGPSTIYLLLAKQFLPSVKGAVC